jgi:hypothetical protein
MNKIMQWFMENKMAACLLAPFILGSLVLGFLSYQSWDDYGKASAEYATKASQLLKLSQQKPFPSQSNLAKLESTIYSEQSSQDTLFKDLQKFQISTFADIDQAKTQDRPQRFQDALRTEVTRIRSLATSTGATLPPGFYLGLEEYENRVPSQDDVQLLAKQLTILSWLADLLTSHKDLILSEFSRLVPETGSKKDAKKNLPTPPVKGSLPYETPCIIKVSFRCNQGSFREIVNSISTAPYFLIMDQLLVQNTSGEPPRRDMQPPVVAPGPDGSAPIQRLPIIVGRELLNVSLKLNGLEFPNPASSATSAIKSAQPKTEAK